MARNVDRHLRQLHARRSGIDQISRLSEDSRMEVMAKAAFADSWEQRAQAKPNTRYALGAMQEVDADYTRISLETADRVGRQLKSGLESAGFSVDFRLQGSVPLNVHIKGVSDVDLLNLDTSFLMYATAGRWSQAGIYRSPTAKTSVGVLSALRRESEKILIAKYPAADVDTSGSKAIKISGGSLARPVDVVPSHWWDTIGYQESGQEYDRGVMILNKKVAETVDNLPFLHIKLILDRCGQTFGGLRKAIRLCKNVKADAIEDGKEIPLPSFDIAATLYHADASALMMGTIYELAILAEAQRHLDVLARNHALAKTLKVPDGSRFIFDTAEKLSGLTRLSIEMDDLASEVGKELMDQTSTFSQPSLSDVREAISSMYIQS